MKKRLPCPIIEDDDYRSLLARVGRCHLEQRLGIEQDFEARIFGQGRTFFHIENWLSLHQLIRFALRLCLIHERGRQNARRVEVRRNDIAVPGLPAAFDGYALLHLSDLHLDIADDITDAVIAAVKAAGSCDLCVITGDFRARTFGPYQAAIDAMGRLREHLPDRLFGILGNHDTIRMVSGLERLGMRLLLNESVRIERDGAVIHLVGIDDPHYYRADNMEKALSTVPVDAVSILLSHSPETYRHAAYASIDVMLSGHTHGGQICLPGGVPVLLNANAPRELCSGPWRFRDLQGYTSVGAGASIVDVRLNCPPEVTVHRLLRSDTRAV